MSGRFVSDELLTKLRAAGRVDLAEILIDGAVIVSAASEHNINFILPLVFLGLPSIGGVPGRPRR